MSTKTRQRRNAAKTSKQRNSEQKLLSQYRADIENKGPVKTSVVFDLGSAAAVIAICEEGKSEVLESRVHGSQIQTVAYEDPKPGKCYFAKVALQRGFDDPGNIAQHFKRSLFDDPHTKKYMGGKYSAVEVTAKFLEHLVEVLLTERPDLRDAEQFGGTRTDVFFGLTVPSDWGLEQTTSLGKAAELAGIKSVDAFIAEPAGALRCINALARVHLRDNDIVACMDVGGGTTDIIFCRYMNGEFNVLLHPSGDPFCAGHDFTWALVKKMGEKFGVCTEGAYDKYGLNLSNVKPENREDVLELWNVAEKDIKPQLSGLEEVSATVNLKSGRKTFVITQKEAASLWKELFKKLVDCLSHALDDAEKFSFQDIAHFVICGGGAKVPGMLPAVSKATGISENDILIPNHCEFAVATGAAEAGFFGLKGDSSIAGGLVLMTTDMTTGKPLNWVLMEPGQVIDAKNGWSTEHTGCFADITSSTSLTVPTAAVKSGVRVKMRPDGKTFLEESEIVPLEPVDVNVDHWPPGRHEVRLGLVANGGYLSLTIHPAGDLGVEGVSVPLSVAEAGEFTKPRSRPKDAVLALDLSSSMKGSDKFPKLLEGSIAFARTMTAKGCSVGVVTFPHNDLDALVACVPTTDARKLTRVIKGFQCRGGTPIDAGIKRSSESLEEAGVIALFTDGQANNPAAALDEAIAAKERGHRILVCGIGYDVNKAWLKTKIASTPDDYFEAVMPDDIPGVFESMSQLLCDANAAYAPPASGPKPANGTTTSTASKDEESWDDVEGLDEEAA